jgi:hypothetical protein
MPEQSLAHRQSAEVVFPQPVNGSMEYTQSQLDAIQHLIGIGLLSYESIYRDVEAILQKPGRSRHHQRYLEERATMFLNLHNWAAEKIIHKAVIDTLENRPAPEREVVRIIEAPRRGIIPRLFHG